MSGRGYAGKLLFVDLSSGRISAEPLTEDLRWNFIGGVGINAKLAYDIIPAGADPLSPENAILIGAGPLVGTLAPGVPKTEITTRSPLTGRLITSSTGQFGPALKYAGYDGIVITGASASPVYLRIFDDQVELCDASSLWGKDVYEVSNELYNLYKPKICTIAAIGPAGENLVKLSLVLTDKLSTWGKGGMGAVLGSKKLKAIVVHGSKGVGVADRERFRELVDAAYNSFRSDPNREMWTTLGTMVSWEMYAQTGVAKGTPEHDPIKLFGPKAYLEQVKAQSLSCPTCPTGCKARLKVKEGPFRGLDTGTSCNLGGAMSFGTTCMVEDYNRVAKCHDTANRLGMESGYVAGMMSFLKELWKRGVISGEDTDGVVPEMGYEKTAHLMEMIAYRRGMGDILADGWDEAARELGPEAEKCREYMRGKGIEPGFDARANLGTEALSPLTTPKGAHWTMGLSVTVVPGRKPEQLARYAQKIGATADAVERMVNPGAPGRYSGLHSGRLLKYVEDFNAVLYSFGICNRPPILRLYGLEECAQFLSAAAGMDIDPAVLPEVGERVVNSLIMFNVREGFDRESFRYPNMWLTEEMKVGDRETPHLTQGEVDRVLDGYYEERGWDVATGRPTREKLASLGLGYMADSL